MRDKRYRSALAQIPGAETFRLHSSAIPLALHYIKLRLWNQLFRRVPFPRQPIYVAAIGVRVFGVDRVLVARRSARDERTASRVRARQCAIRYPVVVDVEVTPELSSELFEKRACILGFEVRFHLELQVG